MNRSALARLACPNCRSHLTIAPSSPVQKELIDGELVCESCGSSFPVDGGIPDLVYPRELLPSDLEFQEKYDVGAAEYDLGLDWLFTVFGEDHAEIRNRLADLLAVDPGARVLETGCGSGEDSKRILERIGPSGSLAATDISRGMLQVAQTKLADSLDQVELYACNGASLPFPDDGFDAAFHFGGINAFGDVRGALAEMDRVVRPGGKVVVGDEGIAPWLRRKRYGRILTNANPLYLHRPPLDKLPGSARDVRLQWLLGNAFYVIDYRVSDSEPPLDVDLPIPGKGDSLRSRFERRAKR